MMCTDTLIVRHYGVDMELHSEAVLYLIEWDVLLISDLHLGRSAHFRAHGIAVPEQVDHDDLRRLEAVIQHYEPTQVLLLGDLFHSTYNHVWEAFASMTHKYREVVFTLIRGNHDILSEDTYRRSTLQVVDRYAIGPFVCTHHPEDVGDSINVYGHIHPGVVLRGAGGQRLRAPAFMMRIDEMIMPAFGHMTGAVSITPRLGDVAYVIADGQIHPVSPEVGR